MAGCVLYRPDGTWIDVDPEEAPGLLQEGQFADSPAGPWGSAPYSPSTGKDAPAPLPEGSAQD